jgi:hypothetical protein
VADERAAHQQGSREAHHYRIGGNEPCLDQFSTLKE